VSDKASSGRAAILEKIRRATAGGESDPDWSSARLEAPPVWTIPKRGQLDLPGRSKLFVAMAEKALATVERVVRADAPEAVAGYLRARNLPLQIRCGDDPALAGMNWDRSLVSVRRGASDGSDLVGLSHAFAGVAESGTLVLLSGRDNPTTINFLPEHHLVLLPEDRIFGDYESIWRLLRERFGSRALPRTVNFITGPSRSGDIEQKLVLGAHGPKSLHILVLV
jgi:L-lactate dehydrogenase complex protein LldG